MVISSRLVLLFVTLYFSFTEELDVEKRIREGHFAEIESFPHAVALERLIGWKFWGVYWGGWEFCCGGSIIDQKWILTANHCLGFDQYRIVYGTTYVSIVWENSDNLAYVKSKNRHMHYDVALLKLENKIEFSSRVNFIELSIWEADQFKFGKLAGWGTQSRGLFSYRSLWLRFVDLQLTANGGLIQGRSSDGKSGGCLGDSGSGLVVEYEGKKYVQAVFTHTQVDNETGDDECLMNLFVSVDHVYEWIETYIRPI